MLVVPELEREVELLWETRDLRQVQIKVLFVLTLILYEIDCDSY